MPKKMLINVADEESRVAIIEKETLEEFESETRRKESIKGNIYKGKLLNIEPSFQAIFVDYGRSRPGFLPFSEVTFKDGKKPERRISERVLRSMKIGDEVLIQIIKDEVGHKGATLSMNVSIPARFIVFMPYSDHMGISRKIVDDERRKRLKEILEVTKKWNEKQFGIIIRTAGIDRTESEILKDFNYICRLWENILVKAEQAKATDLIYEEQDFMIRCIRDYFSTDINEVLIDSRECYKQAKEFFRSVMPRSAKLVRMYKSKTPIFSKYNIESKIEEIYKRKVTLNSGAHIVIDPTEALVSIDVNSGRSTKEKDIEETAFKTNVEAAEEVARQLRLRDLGGLIVIDFIDMRNSKNVREVERVLRTSLKKDKAKVKTTRISKFGILEMSRQRLKPAIREGLFEECSYCKGTGIVKNVEIQSLEILRRIQKETHSGKYKEISVKTRVQAVNYLQNVKRSEIYIMENENNITITLEGDSDIYGEEFTFSFVKKDVRHEPPPPPPKTPKTVGSPEKVTTEKSTVTKSEKPGPVYQRGAKKGWHSNRTRSYYPRYSKQKTLKPHKGKDVTASSGMEWGDVFKDDRVQNSRTAVKEVKKKNMSWEDVFKS